MILFYAMIDDEVTEYAFVDEIFARCHKLSLHALRNVRKLEVFDERLIETEDITHVTQVIMKIENHIEKILMFITKLEYYFIVLEMP